MIAARRTLRALAASAALTACLAVPANALACGNVHADANRASITQVDTSTVCLLNAERRRHGLPSLHVNRKLSLASKRHARSMAAHHYFAHGDFVDRIRAVHYLSGARSWIIGENIAWGSQRLGTPAEIVKAWMDSPPHRANILSRSFREIGIGVSRGAPVAGLNDGVTYATDFGKRG
ncbi:MAG: CAP domain-containing protein [Gaiellaceae bacterium]